MGRGRRRACRSLPTVDEASIEVGPACRAAEGLVDQPLDACAADDRCLEDRAGGELKADRGDRCHANGHGQGFGGADGDGGDRRFVAQRPEAAVDRVDEMLDKTAAREPIVCDPVAQRSLGRRPSRLGRTPPGKAQMMDRRRLPRPPDVTGVNPLDQGNRRGVMSGLKPRRD